MTDFAEWLREADTAFVDFADDLANLAAQQHSTLKLIADANPMLDVRASANDALKAAEAFKEKYQS